MDQGTLAVRGMTCKHCVEQISNEVRAVPGVRTVDVDLQRGHVTVRGDDIDEARIVAAVEEAGYTSAGWLGTGEASIPRPGFRVPWRRVGKDASRH